MPRWVSRVSEGDGTHSLLMLAKRRGTRSEKKCLETTRVLLGSATWPAGPRVKLKTTQAPCSKVIPKLNTVTAELETKRGVLLSSGPRSRTREADLEVTVSRRHLDLLVS